MVSAVQFQKVYTAHFVLIINGKRTFQCLFSETDRDKTYLWMEGYVFGLRDSNIQFDDINNSSDIDLPSTVFW